MLLVWSNFFLFGGFVLSFMVFSGLLCGSSFFVEWSISSVCGLSFSVAILIDMLGVLFFSLVCLITGCVFLFSVGYMGSDGLVSSFCTLTSCFVFAMGAFIFIPHLVFLLLGWDLLGVISFLLVIYYQSKSFVGAGMMTVLMNRVGDVFLLLCIGFGSEFGGLEVLGVGQFGVSNLMVVGALLVGASVTKSAQLPFSTWLLAAMAAPTPISALVHSSTLVTAGVYLLFRYYPLLTAVDGLLFLLGKVGCLTLLMASFSACFEFDVKKLVALSTLSHLGFMVYVLSIGYPAFSVFHLFTHALFKSLLFLCVGCYIYQMASLQDIRQLCGVGWGSSPVLVCCSLISFGSLCGVPYLSGFYSKDAILESSVVVYSGMFEVLCLFVSASASCYYSVRFLIGAVFGVPGGWCYLKSGGFAGDGCMSIPIVLLAVGSVFSGYGMQQVWVESCNMFSVSFSVKLVMFSVVSLGGVVLVFSSFWTGYGEGCKGPMMSFCWPFFVFCGNMWFFRWVFCTFGSWFGVSGTIVSGLEMGWMEVLGGQGSFSLSGALSAKFLMLEYVSVLVVLRFGVILVLSFLIWGYWW